MAEKDVESGQKTRIPFLRQVVDRAGVTPEVRQWHYEGAGTEEDPYVVNWIEDDPRNPMFWGAGRKWFVTMLAAIATLSVAFASSAYSGGADEIIRGFKTSEEIYVLGLSLFVLGFAIGPLLWAPLSEVYGRQVLFTITMGALAAFSAGAAGAQNIQTLIVLRFFAGAFGSSLLTNAGGVIADMFAARERGLAMCLFAAAPFCGPVLGPIVGGFTGQSVGWRWVEGVIAIFTGTFWILGTLLLPETYPPVLQRKRAAQLSNETGKVYRSGGDVRQGPTTLLHVLSTSLSRPWILLFREPIVMLLSIYMAIIYGTLYMLFSAFPVVYQEGRHWSSGIGGLAFLGVLVGMFAAVVYNIWDNKRYAKISDEYKGFAPAETRLMPTIVGGVTLPIGLFWFAWTNSPSLPYMASIAAGVPFGFGMVLVFLGIMNYLVDAYTIFAASVLAANAVLRSLFGCVFPLFTTQMFDNLGIHWASSVPAFLALACVPFPFLFYKYGAAIRKRCKYSAESEAFLRRLQNEMNNNDTSEEDQESDKTHGAADVEKEEAEEERETEEQEAVDYSFEPEKDRGRFREIQAGNTGGSSALKKQKSYDGNPFDLDRVNTKESFASQKRGVSTKRSRASSKASRE